MRAVIANELRLRGLKVQNLQNLTTHKNPLITQVVSNNESLSDLLQVIGRPSTCYMTVRECLAATIREIQVSAKTTL